MAETLVTNKTYTADRLWERGDLVTVQADGFSWGSSETLPDFVFFNVPGLDPAVIEDKLTEWERVIQVDIVSTNVQQDDTRYRAFVTNPGQNQGLTRLEVEDYLISWGAVINAATDNNIRFDHKLLDLYSSPQFWGFDPVGQITITETDYNQVTGIHTATIDATGATVPFDSVIDPLIDVNGNITSIVEPVITVELDRVRLNDIFLNKFKLELFSTLKRRIFHFLESDVDIAVTNGGVRILTETEFFNILQDKTL